MEHVAGTPEQAIARFLDELRLEQLDQMRFRGDPGGGPWDRLFGGTVLAQGSLAAAKTVEHDRRLHSFHAYFLRGGSMRSTIDYAVGPVRDGRTFSTRRVDAVQGGQTICEIVLSFARPEEGIAHADPMPHVPPPEEVPPFEWEPPPGVDEEDVPMWPFEVRPVLPMDQKASPGEDPSDIVWVGLRAPLPDDPLVHTAALIYHSDAGSFGAVTRRHGSDFVHQASASLDHALWLHQPCRWDGWLLDATVSPVAHSGRALSLRRIYTRDGVHVATMAQECIFRT